MAGVERGGIVRAFPIDRKVDEKNLSAHVRANVERSANIMTDGHPGYRKLGAEFASHQYVGHDFGEYVRGNVHTQTVEGYFSLLKRGIIGTYHHVGEQHLHRYVDEFSFRYNGRKVEDGVRAVLTVKGAEGKRLMYRQPSAPSD